MLIFVFYKISTSTLQFFIRFWCHFLQFLPRPTSDSSTFKVAMLHFVFYPCGALLKVVCCITFHSLTALFHGSYFHKTVLTHANPG